MTHNNIKNYINIHFTIFNNVGTNFGKFVRVNVSIDIGLLVDL